MRSPRSRTVKNAVERLATTGVITDVGCSSLGCTPNRLAYSVFIHGVSILGEEVVTRCEPPGQGGESSAYFVAGVAPVRYKWYKSYERSDGSWTRELVSETATYADCTPYDASYTWFQLELTVIDDIGLGQTVYKIVNVVT